MESGKHDYEGGCSGYSMYIHSWEVARDLDGYTIQSREALGTSIQSLVRDCGDFNEITPFNGTVFNDLPLKRIPESAALAPGGIPDERNGVLIKVPYPPFKIPKKKPRNPQEIAKVWNEALKENCAQLSINIMQAWEKALRRQACLETTEEEEEEGGEAHNNTAVTVVFYIAPVPEPGCGLINKDSNGEKGTGSSSCGELNEDSNAV